MALEEPLQNNHGFYSTKPGQRVFFRLGKCLEDSIASDCQHPYFA